LLATSETFTLGDVRCRAPASGWSEVEETRSYALVLTRHGCFYRRADGVDVFVDSATAYISRPGTEQRIAHPADTGDRCTVVRFDQGVGEALQADVFVVDPHTDVEHRRLLAHARQGLDTFELDDRSWILVEALEARAQHLHRASRRPRVALQRRRTIDRVREALATRVASSLPALAADVGVSPQHLSRTFRAHTGFTLTDYRNGLRVRQVLERLSEGERSLVRLAIELGFTDQAHLTRTVRRTVGSTPALLREELGRGAEPLSSGSPSRHSERANSETPREFQEVP
jgi:AraC-like DNA-binding protein